MPFGEYESFEDCVAKNSDKPDPEAYCSTIKRQIEGAAQQQPQLQQAQQYAVFSEPIQLSEDVACCLKVNAVIAKEGVYTFPAGPNGENKQCLWSRIELLKASKLASGAKLTIKEHPAAKVVTSQDEIFGFVEKPFFDRDRIRATLSYSKDIFKERNMMDWLDQIQAVASEVVKPGEEKKKKSDVSIGFYYSEDPTPGEWHGQHYDLVMRNIVIDHVATGVWKGRCTYPNCGIGVSSEEVRQFAAASIKKITEASSTAIPTPPSDPAKPVEPPKAPVTPPTPIPPTTNPPTSTPAKIEPKTPPLTTQELIDHNQSLLDMKSGRSEMQRIEALRNQRRNPLA